MIITPISSSIFFNHRKITLQEKFKHERLIISLKKSRFIGGGRDSNPEARAGEQDQSLSRFEEETGYQRLEGDH